MKFRSALKAAALENRDLVFSMKDIEKLLARKVIFHCKKRGNGDDYRDFETIHSLAESLPQDMTPAWSTPTLDAIYSRWNGVKLFQPSEDIGEGFQLFSVEQVEEELRLLREILRNNLPLYKEGTEFGYLEEWLDGLIPIAEILCSGDKFALDTFRRRKDGECSVVFLDHEGYYGDCCDPESMEKVFETPLELITSVLQNPLTYIDSHWVGGDLNDQWYPESLSIT